MRLYQTPISHEVIKHIRLITMNIDEQYSEKLFSYGTLRYEPVQLATFGRKLTGNPDTLNCFNLSQVEIKDENVIATSGESTHPIISFTGNSEDKVNGFVFDISLKELEQADLYEVTDYKRINVTLSSGVKAWVYVKR